jgi:UDP-hydrolysing UDP-N-acetyl-D-glucosamine 2-epimerase
MRKVCIIITTRGNYAKLKSIIKAIHDDDDLELQLIMGGGAILERYGNIANKLSLEGIRICRLIHFLIEGEIPVTMAKSAGVALGEFATAFDDLKPDVVITIADRFECLPIAIAASYMNIPVAHIEGGEVSGSIDESVRHSISKLSHLHFPATKSAAERIKRLGEPDETIFNVGCTSLDILNELDLNDKSVILKATRNKGVGPSINIDDNYLVVIQHPVTTEYAKNLVHVNQTIKAIDQLKIKAFWLWPNMDAGSDGVSKGIRMYREKKSPDFVHFFKSLPIEEFGPLLYNSKCIVGNSSSGIREASFLGVPSVNIGTRQGGRERADNVIDVDYDEKQIKDAICSQVSIGRFEPSYLYGDGRASQKVIETLKIFDFKIQKRITY